MRTELLPLLRCPQTGQTLLVNDADREHSPSQNGNLETGCLATPDGRYFYRIRQGVPRFVEASNYADNFGMQWNHFRKTQVDSCSGHAISAERFWKATGWQPADLEGQWVLDVGCGAGRFAEIALNAGARVVALDYSSAVDACYATLKHHPNLHPVQGNIYALPFAAESFGFVYSLGVLQHTPDVAAAFAALPRMVAPGGQLCVDYYQKSFKNVLLPKYWLRPFAKRLPKTQLFAILQKVIPVLLPVSRAVGRIPLAGPLLKRFVPVADYYGVLPLNEAQLQEWALLDTFDWLSPEYDYPQTAQTARRWMENSGMTNIEILKAGHLVARGRK